MKRPKIIHASAMCEAVGARGAIVLTFDKGGVQGVSYGETKGECTARGRTLDAIITEIMKDRIPVWSAFSGDVIAVSEATYGGSKDIA